MKALDQIRNANAMDLVLGCVATCFFLMVLAALAIPVVDGLIAAFGRWFS